MTNPTTNSVPAAGLTTSLPIEGSQIVMTCVMAIIGGKVAIPKECLDGSLTLRDSDGNGSLDQIVGVFVAQIPEHQ